VAAKVRAGTGPTPCPSCQAPLERCPTCTAREVLTKTVPHALRGRAREAVRTMGPAALMYGMDWIQRNFAEEPAHDQTGQDRPPAA